MSQDAEPWTVGRLLNWTTDFLRQRGADSPRLDAEVLLAAALACERIQLYATFDQVVDEAPRAAFREFVRRRAQGEPVAYLVGHREFYSLRLQVTPDVLIPRPETELLVMTALDLLKTRPADAAPPRVIDVGTGSGAIAIAIARYAEACEVLGLDVSPAALDVAQRNAESHELAGRVVSWGYRGVYICTPAGLQSHCTVGFSVCQSLGGACVNFFWFPYGKPASLNTFLLTDFKINPHNDPVLRYNAVERIDF